MSQVMYSLSSYHSEIVVFHEMNMVLRTCIRLPMVGSEQVNRLELWPASGAPTSSVTDPDRALVVWV